MRMDLMDYGFAKLSSEDLQLSCRTWQKSRTSLRTLAYYCSTSNIVIIIRYNNACDGNGGEKIIFKIACFRA